jgi:hypothetical protein
MRKFIGLLLAGAVALLVLSGCPKKEKAGDATGGGKAPSPEATKAKMGKMQGSSAPQGR